MRVAGFSDAALSPSFTAGVFLGYHSEIAHELARVFEAGEIAEFRDFCHSGDFLKTAKTHQCADVGFAFPGWEDVFHVLLDSSDSLNPCINGQNVFLQYQLLCEMRHSSSSQVVHVALSPVGFAVIAKPISKHKHAELLFGSRESLGSIRASAAQIPHRLVPCFRDMNSSEFSGTMKPGESTGITLVRFDAVTGFGRDFGWAYDDAMVSELEEASCENKTGRSCFVDNGDFVLLDTELFADSEKAAFGGEIGSAPFAVGLRIRTIAQGGGNNDGVLVDIEYELEFGIHGVF